MPAPLIQTDRGLDLQFQLAEFWEESQDELAMLGAFEVQLSDHTIFTAEHGVSHRLDFPLQVGALIVAQTIEGPMLFEGYNYSPYQGSAKDCAEIRALRLGGEITTELARRRLTALYREQAASWRALKVYVAATSNPDSNEDINTNYDINRLVATTLHPCGTPCRPQLMSHPALSSETPIQTMAVDLHTRRILATELHTLGAMNDMYSNVQPPLTTKQLHERGKTA